ncbi:ABC transporter ATP-binding protein [Candidatus Woesearchaeota archaeon CG08_land_8_20_14_0_20_43_7]|nr:MAG: ABC transporter ATP-binding protein [Candidatus Woesearchaeota archaeon CG08_land_8_20_14_0_20_43_7]
MMIDFNKVNLKYKNKTILKEFSLKIEKGDKILLYGKSGIGKSTILRLLLSFISPDSGNIIYKGKPLTPEIAWQARKEIAYVSQDTDLGEGTVQEIIDEIRSFKTNKNLSDPIQLLKEFSLDRNILKKNITELSGGERQRIAIIIALLLKRDIFLLDELTSSLDSALKKKVIEKFFGRNDATVIAISHDPGWKEKAKKVVRLR